MVHNQNIIRREKLQVYIYFYITGLEYTNGTTDIGGFGAKVKNLLLWSISRTLLPMNLL